MIYFAKMGDHVKIGVSANPTKRVNDLQVGSPHRIELMAVTDGDRRAEQVLHEQFADLCVGGEWFLLKGAIQDYIDSLKTDEGDADLVAGSIGGSLWERRTKAKLSRRELAELAGVSETLIYDVEHGKTTVQLRSILLIANVLNMELMVFAK